MCEYVQENKCIITNHICPFMYWCDNMQIWRPNRYMPTNCKVKENNIVRHKGKYQVRNHRHNYLYVDIDNCTYKILNPFDFVPDYVDVTKTKNGEYKIKK